MRLRYTVDDLLRTVDLTQILRIGRGSDNDVVLPDFSVSRRHAEIRNESSGFVIHDIGSTNGVEVNGERVRAHLLERGDRIKLGVFQLTVVPTPEERFPALRDARLIRPIESLGSWSEIEDSLVAEVPIDDASAEIRRERNYLRSLSRLGRRFIDQQSIDGVLEAVLDEAFDTLGVERGMILLGAPGEARPALVRVGSEITHRPPMEQVPVSRAILEAVMREQVALLTFNAEGDERLVGGGESIRIHGIEAAMCAPLWTDGGISGFIQVDSRRLSGEFEAEDLDYLIALANYAAVAVGRLRERVRRNRLERYHSPRVVEEVLRDREEGETSTIRSADVTVLFADLVGFTAYSERATPEQVASILAEYCNLAVACVFEHGGTLDKFIGDCVMAFFGAPVAQDDHALRGVRAAVAIQRAMHRWNDERREAHLPEVECRVGIYSGPVVVGDVGSEQRVDYTVLGNTVNVAARLESTVAQPGWIVVGSPTRKAIAQHYEVQALGELSLRGLEQRIEAFRVLPSPEELRDEPS